MSASARLVRDEFARVFRYGLSGIASTTLDIALLALLIRLGAWRVLAVSIAFVSGVVLNYYLHRRFTFRSRTIATTQEFARFICVVAINYGVTVGVIEFVVRSGLGSVMVGKLASLPMVMAVGYALTRRFVFRGAGQAHRQ